MKKKRSLKKPLKIQGTKIDNLTLTDIKNLDPRKLSTSTLKTIVGKMTEEANRRIRRIEKAGLAKKSPAVRWLRGGKKHMGKIRYFSMDVKDPWKKKNVKRGYSYYRDQYLEKASELYTFLFEAKTSSVKGVKSFQKDLEARFPGYGELSRARKNDFWEAYNRLLQTPEGQLIRKKADEGGVITSSQAQKVLLSEMEGSGFMDADEIISKMQSTLQDEYEAMTEEAENAEQDNTLDIFLGGEDEDDTPW